MTDTCCYIYRRNNKGQQCNRPLPVRKKNLYCTQHQYQIKNEIACKKIEAQKKPRPGKAKIIKTQVFEIFPPKNYTGRNKAKNIYKNCHTPFSGFILFWS